MSREYVKERKAQIKLERLTTRRPKESAAAKRKRRRAQSEAATRKALTGWTFNRALLERIHNARPGHNINNVCEDILRQWAKKHASVPAAPAQHTPVTQ